MLSSVTYTAANDQTVFAIPFELIDGSYVYAKVAGDAVTAFTVDVGAATLTFDSGIAAGLTVFIYRSTPVTEATEEIDWNPGPVSDADLALEQKKRRAVDEEHRDVFDETEDHLEDDSVHVPTGGATGEFLNKASSTSGDSQWVAGVQITVPAAPDGGVITWDTAGNVTFLAAGASGEFLRANGAGFEPTWEAVTGAGLGDVVGPGITPGSHANATVALYDGADSNVIKEDPLIKRTSSGLLEAQTLRGNNTGGAGSACVALSTDETTILTTGTASPQGSISGSAGTIYFQTDTGTPADSRIWHNRSGSTTWTEVAAGGSSTKTWAWAYGYETSAPASLTTSRQKLHVNQQFESATNWSVVSDTDLTWGGGGTITVEILASINVTGKTANTVPPQVHTEVEVNGAVLGVGDSNPFGSQLMGLEYYSPAPSLAAGVCTWSMITDIADGQTIAIWSRVAAAGGAAEVLNATLTIREMG